jgi:transcriptional regulator with XRE-family HTH domain
LILTLLLDILTNVSENRIFTQEKLIKKRNMPNKFASWMKSQDKKQRGVAEKLGISTSTLHDILKKGQMPSLKLAYQIEIYTKGAITLYDWVDGQVCQQKDKAAKIIEPAVKPKANKK